VKATHQLEDVARASQAACILRLHFAVALFLVVMRGLSAEDPVSNRLRPLEPVHLDHNRPKLLTDEVNSFEVQKVLLGNPSLTAPPAFLSKLNLEVVFDFPEMFRAHEKDKSDNEEDPWLQTELGGVELKWPSAAAKATVPENYQNALNGYLETRLSGHTKSFAVASIRTRGIRPQVADPSLRILLRKHPDIPYAWVKRATRKISASALPEGIEYQVVDGPVVWFFSVSIPQNHVSVDLVDAQETDETLAPKFKEAREEARARLEQCGIKPMLGYVHAYWPELKKVLKEKFGLTWYSPAQLHPTRIYD
jgi:hypothetical protein